MGTQTRTIPLAAPRAESARGASGATPLEPNPVVYRIEIDYKVDAQNMEIRSKAPTIVIEGAIGECLAVPDLIKATPLPADKVARIAVEYDVASDRIVGFVSQGERYIVRGVLLHALGAITRNQMAQNIMRQLAPVEVRLAKLEARVGGKLILPTDVVGGRS